MGDLSPYFNRSEFACNCGCGFDDIDPRLVELLTTIREHFDVKMRINSGCRCFTHNLDVGGARNSQHLLGKASDVVVQNVSPQLVAEAAILYGARGVKNYRTFTHIDVRDGVAWIEVEDQAVLA